MTDDDGDARTSKEQEEISEAIAEIDEETLPHGLPKNNWRSTLIRLAVSLLFLWILFWRLPPVSLDDVIPDFTRSTVAWLVFAVGIHIVAYGLQTLRWSQVSSTLGLHLPFRKMFSFLLAGEFVSNALPTSFGGDVVRVVRQGQETNNFTDSFAATALERLTGWLVLPLLSALAFILRPSLLQLGGASLAAVVLNVATLVGLVGMLWLAGHPRGAGRLVGKTGWTRYVGAVHLGLLAFRHKPWQVVSVLGAGFGFQFLQCVSVFAAARALGLTQVDLITVMAFFPPTAILQNLPLALGGLGVREGAFVLFFGALVVPVADSNAIALGLLVYLIFIVASLAGAPSFALHRNPDRKSRTDRHEPAT
ncbi:MAG TPA: lysylphosphatidylglycerol synthase transmembrane domain-containing protein [Microthrixaceae bacterium]|nr:lysylphosphatidylglycerol synthase transmembrane domain-containing protein [Microthrixaceae bacterium]